MKDDYQILDELLKTKTFDQLHLKEKALLDNLEITPEEFHWLKRSKWALQSSDVQTKPRGFYELDQAFQKEWPLQSNWSRLISHQIPAWQTVAAVVILGLGFYWLGFSTSNNVIQQQAYPVLFCQTDTIVKELIKKDTIYIFPKVKVHKQAPKANTQSIPRNKVIAASSNASLPKKQQEPDNFLIEELEKKQLGYSLQEYPDLKVFFTEEIQ